MNLRMHLGVIWRWRAIVAVGLVLAGTLTFLSVCRVSFSDGVSVTFREKQTWQASETLLVNQQGGLYVTATLAPTSNPSWLTTLTSLYTQIANSASIRGKVFPGGQATKATGDYTASQVLDQSGQPLAVLEFDGTGTSPKQAVTNAHLASFRFRSYVISTSESANVPAKKRVVVNVLSEASVHNAKVIKGRKLTIPIIVFLTVLLATLGLTYVLENLVPRTSIAPSSRRRRTALKPKPKPQSQRTARAAPPSEQHLEPLAEWAETTRRT